MLKTNKLEIEIAYETYANSQYRDEIYILSVAVKFMVQQWWTHRARRTGACSSDCRQSISQSDAHDYDHCTRAMHLIDPVENSAALWLSSHALGTRVALRKSDKNKQPIYVLFCFNQCPSILVWCSELISKHRAHELCTGIVRAASIA